MSSKTLYSYTYIPKLRSNSVLWPRPRKYKLSYKCVNLHPVKCPYSIFLCGDIVKSVKVRQTSLGAGIVSYGLSVGGDSLKIGGGKVYVGLRWDSDSGHNVSWSRLQEFSQYTL